MTLRLYFTKQVANHFGYHPINMRIVSILHRLRALHGMGFAGACLSVSEDGTVVAFEGFVDHGLDFALFVEILLGGVLVEEVIEVELPEAGGFVFDVDFVFVLVDIDEGVFEALFFFGGEEGPDPNRSLYFIRHPKLINLILI